MLKLVIILVLIFSLIIVLEIVDNEDVLITEKIEYHREDGPLIIATSIWEPYVSENGLASNIVLAACEAADLSVKFEYYPWSRCLEMTKSGKAIGTFPWRYTESRDNDFTYSDMFVTSEQVMFYLDSELDQYDFEYIVNASEYTIGMVDSYFYVEVLDPPKKEMVSSEKDGLEMLINGRVDVILLQKANGYAIAKEYFPDYIELLRYHGGYFDIVELGMMASDELVASYEFILAFNEGLDIIKSNGVYEDILKEFEGLNE
jgi:polar amino acid transport system substrate-binding protein